MKTLWVIRTYDCVEVLGGGIYQRRTKNGTGRLKKTVPLGTVKTQRMETEATVSAIDEEVRFFFIFSWSVL